MPPKKGLQRQLFQGIPVWVNESYDMFIYGTEEPYVKIGSAHQLLPNWRELYAPTLESFRTSLAPRNRSQKI